MSWEGCPHWERILPGEGIQPYRPTVLRGGVLSSGFLLVTVATADLAGKWERKSLLWVLSPLAPPGTPALD